MYKFKELEKDEYENFVKQNKKSHFLQSYAWGEFQKKCGNKTPYYVGLVDEDGVVVAATLILQKKLPLNYSYFYAPRGFILDYNNEFIFKNFTKEIVDFAKKKKAIFIKIDPDIIWKSFNYKDEEELLDNNHEEIFKMITNSGFKHLGFTKNFETSQPRYTFRIDLEQDIDTIISHFSKTTKQRIKKAEKLETEVIIGDENDLDTFCKLMKITEERKDFVSHDDNYYKELYKIFNLDNKMTLFLGRINFDKIINKLTNEKEELENAKIEIPKENLSKSAKNKLKEVTRRLENIKNNLEKYKNYKEKFGESITLNGHMIMEYGNKAWVLYAGNENILTETYSNYKVYLEHLKYCKERGLKVYDQFGTIGDLRKDNPRIGLHEFKKKFGGNYIEFIGEFDYITNKLMYFIFTKLVPIYRNIVRKKQKRVIDNEVKRNK